MVNVKPFETIVTATVYKHACMNVFTFYINNIK